VCNALTVGANGSKHVRSGIPTGQLSNCAVIRGAKSPKCLWQRQYEIVRERLVWYPLVDSFLTAP